MKMFKIAAVLALIVTGLGSCKKEVTQVVNQVYSVTYTIQTTDWVLDNSGLNYYKVDISVPEVNSAIVRDGAVVVYLSFDNGASFDALPEDVGGYTYNAFHSTGTVTVGYRADSGNPAALPGGVVLAKIIVLDGQPL
jgi:glucan-binding YG repeat protein